MKSMSKSCVNQWLTVQQVSMVMGAVCQASPTPVVAKLVAPASLSPRHDARFSCAAFGTEIELVWNAVPGAASRAIRLGAGG